MKKKSDLVKSDHLAILKSVIPHTGVDAWSKFYWEKKWRVEEVNNRLHLAANLYLNRKVKAEVSGKKEELTEVRKSF